MTPSDKLVRMPESICGAAAGKTTQISRRIQGSRYERATSSKPGSTPRTPSMVLSKIGQEVAYAMTDILKGARLREKEQAAAKAVK